MSIELRHLAITKPDQKPLFSEVNLVVNSGEVACIMGPSGVGKSTLLSAIGGHLNHHFKMSGELLLNSKSIVHLEARKRSIGLLFQDPLLFPHLSVGDNLAYGLSPNIKGKRERRSAVEEALSQAQLDGFYDRDPKTLSGGQQGRAALMRAILAKPSALLLDEPFSKLDVKLRQSMREFLYSQAKSANIPMIIVTHDPLDAAHATGSVIELKA